MLYIDLTQLIAPNGSVVVGLEPHDIKYVAMMLQQLRESFLVVLLPYNLYHCNTQPLAPTTAPTGAGAAPGITHSKKCSSGDIK